MKTKTIFLILFSFYQLTSFSQLSFFKENFESGIIPDTWTQVKIQGNTFNQKILWAVRDELLTPPNPNPFPDTAASKRYFPYFLYTGKNGEATRLITPQMNMLGKVKPMLDFYLIQKRWYRNLEWKNNNISVLYRSGTDTNFYLLREYVLNINNWTQQQILLPDSILKNNFYLAFEGKNAQGPATCIDSIHIYETDVAPRQVLNINLTQPIKDYVTAGTTTNQIARLDIYVGGNQNTVTFNSISLTSNNTDDLDVITNGVHIYKTADTVWNNPVLIPVSASFTSNKAQFTGLNESLTSGLNVYWITYDVNENAPSKHFLDCSIGANDINIDGASFPATQLNPSGSRSIRQLLFFDGFESNKGWLLKTDFERAAPQGKGGFIGAGSYGLPDPMNAYSGTNVLGNDLSGIEVGVGNGNYLPNLTTDTACYAESPEINCKYFKNVLLRFQRKLGVHVSDKASILISKNGGLTWENFWTNEDEGGSIADNLWKTKEYNLSNIADRVEKLKFRFSIGPTTGINLGSGWNIDNFIISADTVANDVGVTQWISPLSGCGLSNAEEIKVKVKNFSNKNSPNKIPLEYTFDGITYYSDTLHTTLLPDQEVIFTFSKKYDLSQPDFYPNVEARTTLNIDDDIRNNSIQHQLYSIEYIDLPLEENFENKIVWKTDSSNTWQHGTPDKPDFIEGAFSGEKAIVTNLYTFYNNNQSSYIETPCLNFSNVAAPVISFMYSSQLEYHKDGVSLNYSTDNGATWNIVPNHPYSWFGNWYTNTVNALGTKGWDTITNNLWINARQALPSSLAGESNVKFRFIFKSDSTNTNAGFAFDDFKITEAPLDIAIESVDTIKNACIGENPNKPWFTLKNAGIRPILPTDSFQVSYRINGGSAITETFHLINPLAINDNIALQFQTSTQLLDEAGTYNIQITGHDPIPDFYETNNDTAEISITIYALPYSGLADTISSARLDTTIVRPHIDPFYVYTWPDNSHLTSWNTTTPGSYWVDLKINDTNGCTVRDSFVINQLIRNYDASTIISPVSNCELNALSQVSFSFKNSGTDTLETDEIAAIQAHYKLNNNPAQNQTFNFSNRLLPNDSIVFTFTNPINNIASGDVLKVYFESISLDADQTNDTVMSTITEFGFPTVNIGNDTIVYGAFYELNAGAGFKTYKWNDSTDLQTYKATFVGKHWVRVTDNNDCPASDTAYITILRHDLSVKNILNPSSNCTLSSSEKVKIDIHNDGTDTISAATNINLGYILNNGSPVTSNIILSDILLPDSSIIFEYSQTENLSNIGAYRLQAYAKIPGDMTTANDTITDTIRVFGYPALNLGTDKSIKALQYVLDAGGGANRIFLWQNDSTTQQFNVTESGTYSVKVSDSNSGCSSFDTIHVNLSIDDGGITELTSPENNKSCTGTFNKMEVVFKNLGTEPVLSGQKVVLGYTTRNITIRDTITLNANLVPDDSIFHTFNSLDYIFIPGNNDFSIFSSLTGDMRSGNDTLFTNIYVYNTPVVGLGGTIVSYTPVTLDAGSGSGYTYLWNDSSISQTLIIDSTGLSPQKYFVRVTEPNGCEKSDTVKVSVYYPDVNVNAIENTISSCSNEITSATLICKNMGNNTLKAGQSINFLLRSYNNGNEFPYAEVPEIYILKKDLANGDTFKYVYNNIIQSVNTGSNALKFVCTTLNDINTNDTFTYNLTVYEAPFVEIGNDIDTIVATPPYTFNVGLGNDYYYLWQDGSTSETLLADTTHWYKVTARHKTNFCTSSDSVYLDMEINDLAIKNISFDGFKCINYLDDFNIELTNEGNRTIGSGEIIEVKYVLNETKTSTFNTSFPLGLEPKSSQLVNCNGLKPYFKAGLNNLKIYITYIKDQKASNDSLITSFTVNTNPALTLSNVNDTLELFKPYTLTAGANASYNYVWNHSETGRVINATLTGKYIVTANDPATGCESKDSVVAILIIYDGITTSKTEDLLCVGHLNSIEISYKNTGQYTFPAGTNIEMGYIFNNNQTAEKVVTLSEALSPNDEISTSFSDLGVYNIVGTNSIKTFSSNALDTLKQNDTSTLVLNIAPNPSVNIAGGDTIELESPFIITAESPDDVSYFWNTGEETSSIKALENDKYFVRVTSNTSSCYAYDTVYIKSLFTDGSLSKVEFNNPLCINSISNMTVTYKNAGIMSFVSSDTIDFHYRFNNGTDRLVREILSSSFAKGETKLITKNINKTDLITGTNSILVYAKTRKDQNNFNDTIRTSIVVNAAPSISLANGDDIVTFSTNYVLDAGSGFSSYLWNTNATSQKITVSTSGYFGITVTNELGCFATDSVLMKKLTTIEGMEADQNLKIFPVPTNAYFNVEVNKTNLIDPILEIYSSDMKLVLKEHYIAISDGFTKSFNSSSWKKGIYYVCIREKTGKIIMSNKLIVQ